MGGGGKICWEGGAKPPDLNLGYASVRGASGKVLLHEMRPQEDV